MRARWWIGVTVACAAGCGSGTPAADQAPAATATAASAAGQPTTAGGPATSASGAAVAHAPPADGIDRQAWAQLLGRGIPQSFRGDDENRYYQDCRPFMALVSGVAGAGSPVGPALLEQVQAALQDKPLGMSPAQIQWCAEYMQGEMKRYLAAARDPGSAPPEPVRTFEVPEAPVGLPSWSVGTQVDVAFVALPFNVQDQACAQDGLVEGLHCAFGASGAAHPKGGEPSRDARVLVPIDVRAPAHGLDKKVLVAGLWTQPAMAQWLTRDVPAPLSVRCRMTIVGAAKDAKVRSPLGGWDEGYHPYVGRLTACNAKKMNLSDPPPINE